MRKGFSRAEVAYRAGLSEKQIGVIERGEARYSRMSTLAGIADALDEDVLDLFTPTPRRTRPTNPRGGRRC